MMRPPNEGDPRSVWQDQKLPDEPLSFEVIRRKAKRVDSRILRGTCVFVAALAVFLILNPAPFIFGANALFVPVQFLALMVVLVYAPNLGYLIESRRRMVTLSRAMAEPSLVFYREKLFSMTDMNRLKVQLIQLAFGAVVQGLRSPATVIPLAVVAAFWIYFSNKREIDRATRELAALAEFQRSERNL